MGSSVTIRDIAAVAGVGKSTVAYALKDHPKIPAATRQRIQKIAVEMGYSRSPLLSAWMSQIRGTPANAPLIAFLSSESEEDLIQEPVRLFLIEACREVAEKLGYRLVRVDLGEEGLDAEQLQQRLTGQGVRGLILGGEGSVQLIEPTDWSPFATVSLNLSNKWPETDRLVPDVYAATQLVLSELSKLGYRRVGLVESRASQEATYGAHYGAMSGQAALRSLPQVVPPLFYEEMDELSGLLPKWLDLNRPQVLLTPSSNLASLLSDLHIDVPVNLGMACLSLQPSDIGIGGVRLDMQELAQAALQLIDGKLARNVTGLPESPLTVSIGYRWEVGETLQDLTDPNSQTHPGVMVSSRVPVSPIRRNN